MDSNQIKEAYRYATHLGLSVEDRMGYLDKIQKQLDYHRELLTQQKRAEELARKTLTFAQLKVHLDSFAHKRHRQRCGTLSGSQVINGHARDAKFVEDFMAFLSSAE